MDLATISLLALLLAVVVSCVTSINVGLLGFVLAGVIGFNVAPAMGLELSKEQIFACFPVELALQLIGVSLLFTQAQLNGTLPRVAQLGTWLCRGRAAWVPVMFFLLSCGLSAAGAGNIAAVALVAPAAMLTGARLGISPLLMAIMISHGSIAGALSPYSPIGIIAQSNLDQMGLAGHELYIFGTNFATNAIAACLGYLILRGWRSTLSPMLANTSAEEDHRPVFERHHVATLIVAGVFFVGVIGFHVHLGFGAFAAAVVLVALRVANERPAIQQLPWGVILMVSGMSTLVRLCEKTDGVKQLAALLAQYADASSATGLLAFTTGVISIFSSTSGVVLPVFLKLVPDLVNDIPGTTALALASAVNIGGNLVDASPVSTIGALCMAAAPAAVDRQRLFRQMLLWGVGMAIAGAVVCQVML